MPKTAVFLPDIFAPGQSGAKEGPKQRMRESKDLPTMADIKINAKREETVEVGNDNAISFLGPEGPRVLGTPHMIGFMERTCRNLVLEMLDEGFDTVGTHVNVSHCA